MSLDWVSQKLLRTFCGNFCGGGASFLQNTDAKGGLFMSRRRLEIAFGLVSGAVGLLTALITAVIATKE